MNLDPANDGLPYDCAVNIMELVDLQTVQDELKLGPNGGLIYCMDYLLENLDWLEEKLQALHSEDHESYVVFDCPGQVELFTLHDGFKKVLETMAQKWDYRLVALHLIDSHLCTDPAK